MRKPCITAILILIACLPLAASISFPSGLSYDDEQMLGRIFDEAAGNRRDVPVLVDSFFADQDGLLRLEFSIDGKKRCMTAADEQMLETMVSDALYSERAFYVEEGPVVEEIYGSFIMADGHLEKGRLFKAVGEDGKVEALLRAEDDTDGGKALLSALMQRRLLPGQKIVSGPSLALDFSVSSPLTAMDVEASATLRFLSLIPFIQPRIGFDYIYRRGVNMFFLSIGFETVAELSKLSDTAFTLIQDAGIYASLEILLGYGQGGFQPSASYGIGYEHRISSSLYWRIGYCYNHIIGSELRLSGGVLF